jgi:putative tryptophan/tyrosine transport system substrate-binding protein
VKRREFITLLGGAGLLCAAKARRARAQQPMPMIGFLSGGSPAGYGSSVVGFRNGLNETGFVEDRNSTIAGWMVTLIGCPRLQTTWFGVVSL